jgi:cytochrome o ubiquinol oxidase subunit IV
MERTSLNSTGASLGTLKSYATGFLLSVVLTVVSFGVVISGIESHSTILISIFCLAIAQILVHLHYFLHLNTSSEARWNVLAIVFTFLILFLFVGGTLWIMHNLNYRMM